jgi:hypothetical protein
VTVELNPTSIEYSFPANGQGLNAPGVSVTGNFVTTPSGSVYPSVAETDSDQVLGAPPYTFTGNYSSGFTGTIPFNPNLAVGTYTGYFLLNLYQTSSLTSPYTVTGGSVPFTVTVTPGIVLTALVNAVPTELSNLDVPSGTVVKFTSSVPVEWSTASGGGLFSNPVITTTSWQATITYGSGNGALYVNAFTPAAANTDQAQVTAKIFVSE